MKKTIKYQHIDLSFLWLHDCILFKQKSLKFEQIKYIED